MIKLNAYRLHNKQFILIFLRTKYIKLASVRQNKWQTIRLKYCGLYLKMYSNILTIIELLNISKYLYPFYKMTKLK